MSPGERAAQAARASYGRLLALVASFTQDLAAAEDALGEAFLAALDQWPRDGVPDRPEAWLVAVARRRSIDVMRRVQGHQEVVDALGVLTDWTMPDGLGSPFPDKRLALLFVCAHPAIDASARTPLMLQTVLGLEAQRIAGVMQVAPKTMGQRLWRAKTKIREAGIAFEVPEAEELPERLDAVLAAVYAAYGSAWDEGDEAFGEEARFLAELLVGLMPHEAEPRGLLALVLFLQARRPAHRGGYVPLDEQDPARWAMPLVAEAERQLRAAAALGRLGPYQLEAAIQSAHMAARRGVADTGAVVLQLYDGLLAIAPSLGARVARAAALARVEGPGAGLAALDALDPEQLAGYQPAWALRAHLLQALGRASGAAYEQAIALATSPAVRAFLRARRDRTIKI